MAENKSLHRDCEPHTAENCDINSHSNLDPSMDDCGHYVNEGPGVQKVGDLNIYETVNGKKAIVAGGPKHNLNQDVAHGPDFDTNKKEIKYTDDYGKHAIVSDGPKSNPNK